MNVENDFLFFQIQEDPTRAINIRFAGRDQMTDERIEEPYDRAFQLQASAFLQQRYEVE